MYYGICEICKIKQATEAHHKFSQSKLNIKMYGDLINNPANIMYVCEACHKWKPIPKFTEQEFCDALGINKKQRRTF